MALDCSPESSPHKMNPTFFVSIVPTCEPPPPPRPGWVSLDPGHHVNKIDKGLQGNATFQKSKLYPLQLERRRILKLVFFVPMYQLVTPQGGASFDPRGII